jgi:aryl-alcohol dehydrogenase-like predicted oxidoreductase
LHWALDHGIGYFDTAAGYGHSEELLGRAFGGRSPRPVIATKVAVHSEAEGKLLRGKALAAQLENSVFKSLEHLGTEELDLLQIHAPAVGAFIGAELLELMEHFTRQGRVRYWGVSTYGAEQPLQALEHPRTIRSVQVAHNLLDRSLKGAVFPTCAALGVGLILRSVFLKGVLSDRLETLPSHLAALQGAGQQAQRLAEELGISLPALALRYAASQPQAQVVLVGTAAVGELAGNLEAFSAGPLPAEILTRIETIDIEDQALLNPGTWGI